MTDWAQLVAIGQGIWRKHGPADGERLADRHITALDAAVGAELDRRGIVHYLGARERVYGASWGWWDITTTKDWTNAFGKNIGPVTGIWADSAEEAVICRAMWPPHDMTVLAVERRTTFTPEEPDDEPDMPAPTFEPVTDLLALLGEEWAI